ncbi:hypothetical protein D3C85_1376150 [compost metagenome]
MNPPTTADIMQEYTNDFEIAVTIWVSTVSRARFSTRVGRLWTVRISVQVATSVNAVNDTTNEVKRL